MSVCFISAVSVRDRGKGRGWRASIPTGQDLTLCLMANLLWGTMRMGSNRLTAVCTNFKLLATPFTNTSV